MTTNYLPDDVARCVGAFAGPQGWNIAPECQDCKRRTAPRYRDIHSFIDPAPATQFPCEFRIAPEGEAS